MAEGKTKKIGVKNNIHTYNGLRNSVLRNNYFGFGSVGKRNAPRPLSTHNIFIVAGNNNY